MLASEESHRSWKVRKSAEQTRSRAAPIDVLPVVGCKLQHEPTSVSSFNFRQPETMSVSCTDHDATIYTHIRQAYILENQVTHIRHAPTSASHAFAYPTVSLLVSLNELERRRLDLGRGYIFGYNSVIPGLTGIRSRAHLSGAPTSSIGDKLKLLLRDKYKRVGELEEAWMMTMPSICGFQGINPLTTYFCYDARHEFRVLVLEVSSLFIGHAVI